MKAYWFSEEDGTTANLTKPAKVGQTDKIKGTPIPCHHGLHGSPTPWDALAYARGATIWIVELGGEIVEHGNPIDKYAAQERTYLFELDITQQLRMFSAQCALSVFDEWHPPDVVREYIEDEAKGIDRSDLRDAARDAAWDAAWAAWDAAWAAWDAAGDAAWAAWDAAWAAWDAAGDAQRTNFNRIVADALIEAGWSE